jgi:hypothetical protein
MNSSERGKARRLALKSKGLCIECGLVESKNGVKCEACAKISRNNNKNYDKRNPGRRNQLFQESLIKYPSKRIKCNEKANEWRWRRRLKVIALHGGECKCCGETTPQWLEIHHVDDDGKKHRMEMRNSSNALLKDLLDHPNKYKIEILCSNCHRAITVFGKCPH